jgi:hypothetical protein
MKKSQGESVNAMNLLNEIQSNTIISIKINLCDNSDKNKMDKVPFSEEKLAKETENRGMTLVYSDDGTPYFMSPDETLHSLTIEEENCTI